MKVKVKFDKKTVQEFLLQNVEKIVLGIIVLGVLFMLYSAFTGAKSYQRTPEELQEQVRRSQQELDSTPPESGLTVTEYSRQTKRSRLHAEEKPYLHMTLWDAPLFPKRPLRAEPPLFAVQKLRGAAGVGAFRSVPVNAEPNEKAKADKKAKATEKKAREPIMPVARSVGGEVTGQRWIVITALVPAEKQEKAFEETFKPSVYYDPTHDIPEYLGYWVERVEITSTDDAANPDWEKKSVKFVSKQEMDKAEERFGAASSAEVVDPDYIEESLTFPLGPLANRHWGVEVAHEPDIPILEKGDFRGANIGPGVRMGPMGEPGRGRAAPRVRNNRAVRGPMLEGGRTRESAADDTPFGDKPEEADANANAGAEAAAMDEKGIPSYRLFRFFDYNVEPGKQYVYRVCLALANPNKNLKENYLAKAEYAKQKFLKTKWSDPTSPIAVPRDTRILASSVKPGRASAEPSGQILVAKWLKSKGIEVCKDFTVVRGQQADFSEVEVKPTKKAAAPARRGGDMMGLGGGRPAMTQTGPSITVNFITGATAIDFRGGEKLAGPRGTTLTSAGEILLLDNDGKLIVRNELDDRAEYDKLTTAEHEGFEEGGGRGMGPGMMMPPGGGARPPGGLDLLDGGAPRTRRGSR